MSEWQPKNVDSITLAVTLPEGGFPFSDLVGALKAAVAIEHRRGNPAGAQTLHSLACLADAGLHALEAAKGAPFLPAPPTDQKDTPPNSLDDPAASEMTEARSGRVVGFESQPEAPTTTPRPAHSPVGADLRAVLQEHWLTGIGCDHEAKTNRATCYCTVWRSDLMPSVGAAVNAWIDHVMSFVAPPQVTDEMVERAAQAKYARIWGRVRDANGNPGMPCNYEATMAIYRNEAREELTAALGKEGDDASANASYALIR